MLCSLALVPFVTELIVLLAGTPTWRLPVSGGVVDLVTASDGDGQRVVLAAGRREVFGSSYFWFGDGNEFDSTEKPLHTLRV